MSAYTDAAYDLTGQVAVVTGGSRGLGREMCLEFARHGASVVIASRKIDSCEALAAEVAADESIPAGVETLPIACHVGRWDDCNALVAATLERFGRLDVLVNNAGMSPLYPSLGAISEDLYDKVFDVNLKGPFRLSALAAEHMQANGGGRIINVSSIAAKQPSDREVPYAMAKAGLNALTVALAHMFGPTVRVNGIMPGAFLTDISKAWDLAAFNERAKEFPLQRGGEPHEIIGAALYLATNASSYTTGSVLKVDGGVVWSP
ncbi:SDR family NAD(P)-dependent oxidoreductase [Desertimonas flava]|uniref:SDR family NAD(P)-dependent oxidoreductase n=1 Tax=Desertimonas flava TaxID=2064846 RepID=UPI000E34DD0E|nr:glucose 1-dehydrogenase [Desertimonas flava]